MISSDQEREHLELHADLARTYHREGPPTSPTRMGALPWRVVERRPVTTTAIFTPCSDQGWASTNGFSGYNQIKMGPKDMTKTTFITE